MDAGTSDGTMDAADTESSVPADAVVADDGERDLESGVLDAPKPPPPDADGSVTAETAVPDTPAEAGDAPSDTSDDGGCVTGKSPPALKCDSPKEGKLVEFQKGTRPKDGTPLKLTGLVATSGKFRVSHSKTTGTCLYGVFVADKNATFEPFSGILVVSSGTLACGDDKCTEGDLIPSAIKPGDVVDIVGRYTELGPTADACAKATPPRPLPTPAKQPQVANVCSFTKTGDGVALLPAAVEPKDIEGGATGLLQWAGGLVQIKAVKAGSATKPGDLSFGKFQIDGSKLEVSSKVYFQGGSTAPTVNVGDAFVQITGVSYLDFCTWTLAPRTICDHTPVPGDASKCGGPTGDAGTD